MTGPDVPNHDRPDGNHPPFEPQRGSDPNPQHAGPEQFQYLPQQSEQARAQSFQSPTYSSPMPQQSGHPHSQGMLGQGLGQGQGQTPLGRAGFAAGSHPLVRYVLRDREPAIAAAVTFLAAIGLFIANFLPWAWSEDGGSGVSATGRMLGDDMEVASLSRAEAEAFGIVQELISAAFGPISSALSLTPWFALLAAVLMLTTARGLAARMLLGVALVSLLIPGVLILLNEETRAGGSLTAFALWIVLALCAGFVIYIDSKMSYRHRPTAPSGPAPMAG